MHNYPSCALRLLALDCLLSRHEEPRGGDEEAHADADAQRAGGAELEEDGAGDEGAEEERGGGDELVVARDDAAAQREEAGVGHELDPDGGQDDCKRVTEENS